MGAVGVLLLGLIKTLITVWELLTNWAYNLLTNPGQKVKDHARILSSPQEGTRNVLAEEELRNSYHFNVKLILNLSG